MKVTEDRRTELVPRGKKLFGNCHASTVVELPDGGLLVAFFGGEREGAGDNAIWLARCDAGTWQPPERRFARDGLAHWNPVLHAEGEQVWLFYKTGTSVHDWVTSIAASTDGGRSWGAPRPLVAGETAPRGPVRNKVLVLADGAWLAPGSVETSAHWDAFADRSTDRGTTWQRADVPLTHVAGGAPGEGIWAGLAANALWETSLDTVFKWDGVIQPTLWESAPGEVHMLLRSTRGKIFRSDSTDGGRSWCEAYPTAQPNNNSGIDLVRRADGTLLLVCNPVDANWGRRTPLSLLSSQDDGAHWQHLADLESGEGEFSYPAIIEGRDGTIHVTTTADRLTIVHHALRVA